MVYGLISEITMVMHFLVIAYIGLGGLLAWRWPRLIWPHLAICTWGLVQLTGLVECPLTAVENWARAGAGERGLAPGGFIDTYIEGMIYPEAYANQVRLIVVAIVLASWARFALRALRGRRAAGRAVTPPGCRRSSPRTTGRSPGSARTASR